MIPTTLCILLLLPTILTGCGQISQGPSSKEDVCEEYDQLADEVGKMDRVFDNSLFSAAGSLGRVAQRYEADSGVVANGERLVEISDGDSTDEVQLDSATASISGLCGQTSLSAYGAKRGLGISE